MRSKRPEPFGPRAERMPQAIRMVHALGVAADLLADHPARVGVARASRARARSCGDRGARPPGRRCWCSRAGTPRGRSRPESGPWPPAYLRETMGRWGPRSGPSRGHRAVERASALAPPARRAGCRGLVCGRGHDAARLRPGDAGRRRRPWSSACWARSRRSASMASHQRAGRALGEPRARARGPRLVRAARRPRAGDRHGPPRPAPDRRGAGRGADEG